MGIAFAAVQRLGQLLLRAQGFRAREARTADGRRFFIYERAGFGRGPPALLVHGLGGAATSFSPIARRLCGLCKKVLLVDLPGHGRAALRDAGDEPASALELAQALAKVLEELGEPALLIGNSLGGALVLGMTLLLPKQVAGVVGLAPAGAPFSEEEAAQVRTVFRGGAESGLDLAQRLFFKPPWAVKLLAAGLGENAGELAVQHIVQRIRAGEQGLPVEQLREMRTPALVLWAAADRVLPPSGADFFRSTLPPGSFELLERCGHLPQIERTHAVMRRLEKFIAALPPRAA